LINVDECSVYSHLTNNGIVRANRLELGWGHP
jgi:hypothetical protein